MPTRMLRDWTLSQKVDKLSLGAETFFARLIMKADDLGRYYATPKLLRSTLFPLREYTESQVGEWLTECKKAKLVVCYSANDREYLEINDFGQRLRQMISKFPAPADGTLTVDGQLSDNGRLEEKRREEEYEVEEEEEHEGASAQVLVWPTFDDWWELYSKKVDRSKCEKKWKKISQEVREKIMRHTEDYVKSTPEVQYRRHPATYLNNETWNNEIVIPNGKQTSTNKNKSFDSSGWAESIAGTFNGTDK